jgi:phosphoglycerate dehydrogenase-like enzyme/glyoxylase-like metal-dependent hydrolase (beta-lactamase superfamily II)
MSSSVRLVVVFALAVLPLLRTPRSARDASPAGPGPEIREVAPGVFFARTPTEPEFLGSNSGFVVMEQEVLVVDASFPVIARAVVDEVRKRTDRPIRFAFDTHHHPDHCFGNDVLAGAGAAVIAQRRCFEEQRTSGPAAFQKQSQGDGAAVVAGASWRGATVLFDDRFELGDGKRHVQLLSFGRGHTRGDSVAWLPDERVLFTGDLCVDGAFNYLGEGDSEHWIAVLDRLIALAPKVVCPGHGAAGGPELLEKQKRWFVELRAAVAAGLEAGETADAIRDRLDLPWYQEWTGVAAKSRTENVRRIYAEMAGLVAPMALTDDLGLKPSGPAPKDQPGWVAPKKVIVPALDERALASLRRVAPGVELAVAKNSDEAIKLAADADGAIGSPTPALLDASPKLRWIQVGSAGVERYVGLPRIASRAVTLTNAQRLYGPEIADHAVGLLLALTRQLPAALANQRDGRRWQLDEGASDAMTELRGRTVLVAGLGGIGREIAQRVAGFGAHVIATEGHPKEPPPFVEQVGGPDQLFPFAARADVVFVCVPLTTQTEKLCGEPFFAALKRGAIVINVARGRCVDTGALLAALKDGRVGGAGLDVTDPEPLPPDHELWKLRNVIVTPHDAAQSAEASSRQFLLFRENLRRFAAGEALLSVVDPDAGY